MNSFQGKFAFLLGLLALILCQINHTTTSQLLATAGPPEVSISGPLIDVNSVLNLSKLKLTPAMLSVFNKGLSFCPSSPDVDYSNVMSGLDNVLRQMCRTAFFDRLSHINDDFPSNNWLLDSTQSCSLTCQPFDHHSFKEPSNFDPKSDSQIVLNFFCKSVTDDTYVSPIKPFRRYNLTKEEYFALEELKTNPNIVIKPADKGGKIVIQDPLLHQNSKRASIKHQSLQADHC